jgi:hypothetical protein
MKPGEHCVKVIIEQPAQFARGAIRVAQGNLRRTLLPARFDVRDI